MNERMNELSLFSGVGGSCLGTHHLLGWNIIGYVEKEEYPARILEQRIRDGALPMAPVYQITVREFTELGYAKLYCGLVNVITAGFPCQPFSQAGKRLAENDPRNRAPARYPRKAGLGAGTVCTSRRRTAPSPIFSQHVGAFRHGGGCLTR